MSKLIESMLPNVNAILSVREKLGAELKSSFLVTRTWSGGRLGLGEASEVREKIEPQPRVVEFSAESRFLDGGVIKQGDIMLKMISKATYPNANLIDCSSGQAVEKFYVVGGVEFQLLSVREKHLTWDVHLRRRSRQGV